MKNVAIRKGVSLIICCYNSEKRLPETLLAISKQEVSPDLRWEIILVDNASTDNTAILANSIWNELNNPVELRIVKESKPGLGNARNKGISEALFSILLFCDDDNWLSPNYLQDTYDIFEADRNIAASGGKGIPVFETEKPYWFDEYAEAFAIGSQEINREDGRLLNLYGAGMAIRKTALDQLFASGFVPIMQGRVGKKLTSSEDTELTYAFVLMGYKLHYSKDLTFFHYLPAGRLQLDYFKRLFTAFGVDGPVRNLYYAHISERSFHKRIKNWNIHLMLSIIRLFKYLVIPPKKYGRSLYFGWNIAYIRQLFAIRSNYTALNENISRIKNILKSKLYAKEKSHLESY